MEEIRCPMCGRQNPADRDVCQYCEARLKPLTGPLSESEPAQREEDDWLGSLRSEADMSDDEGSDWSEEEFREEGEGQRDPLDWLSSIDQQTGSGPTPRSEQAEGAEITSPESPSDSESKEEQVDLAAWLASLDEQDQAESGPRRTPAEQESDWLSEFESRQPAPPPEEPDEDLPDWLDGRSDEPEAVDPDVPDEVEGLPDWLQEEQAAETEPTAEEAAELEADLPEWLQEIGSGPEAGEPGEVASEAEEIPTAPQPAEEPAAEISAENVVEPLDEKELQEFDLEAQQTLAGEPSGEKGLPGEPEAAGSQDDEFFADQGEPSDLEDQIAAGEMPDWLSDLQPDEELEQAGELGASGLPAPSPETADWLSELASDVESAEQTGQPEEADLDQPFTFDGSPEELSGLDLAEEPEWLSELEEQAGEQSGEEGAEEIARADLPEWLAAMRPVDSIVTPQTMPEETGLEVESAGPLTGLHDVLPAEPEVFQISKPEIQTVKLNVTEGQQKHIALLSQMLKEDVRAVPVEKEQGPGLQRILRWLIALVMLVAAFFGLFSGFSIAELPPVTPEVNAVYQAISALPAQAPVMVAFDYEPGLSAEMDTVAAALLNHLMERGVRLTLVSTTPTGPILGEGVIQGLPQHNYARDTQYINLGYIPGGPTGLQSFSSLPLPFLLPLTFSGYEAWEPRLAPLAGVEQLDDYALLLVLTDRQETARAWIEQVGPTIQNAPVLFGISAQIAPIIRPYYSGTPNLVDGFVAGISGSGAYEQLTGTAGWTSNNWNIYTLLVLVAAGVILLGGLVNAILGSRSQSSKLDEEANA